MKKSKGITIDGIPIEEYLRKNERIEKPEFTPDKVYLHRHKRVKYAEYMERNGDVVTLNQRQLNAHQFESEMQKYAKERDIRKCCVVAMACRETRGGISAVEIAKAIDHIKPLKNTLFRVRTTLGKIRSTALGQFMEFHKKGPQHPARYEIIDQSISIKDALELCNRKTVAKPFEKIQDRPIYRKNDPSETIIETEKATIIIKGDIKVYINL